MLIDMKQRLMFCLFLLSGCGGSQIAFELSPASETFRQNDIQSSNTIDVLWVIDNSGSMQNSQNNLSSNFDTFLNRFSSRGMDFQMAVTTTEAYRAEFLGDLLKSEFRSNSGYKIVTPNTPAFRDTMLSNLIQGTAGDGDERAFQSFMAALTNPLNAGLVRRDSFLAIIILSDEDDFSYSGSPSIAPNYLDPLIHPVTLYRDQLDALTNSTPEFRKYSVSTIAVQDQACLDELLWTSSGQKIGKRYQQLATMTEGVSANICGNFSEALEQISSRLLELLTGFRLRRVPKVSSITVNVDGSAVQQNALNGWTYDSTRNMIVFHGASIPRRSSIISVNFQPIDPRLQSSLTRF